MTSFRAFSSALTMSVAVHAFLGYAIAVPPAPVGPGVSEPIQIDYVRFETTPPPAAKTASAEIKAPAPRKKVKGIPIPRVQMTAASEESAPDFQKIVDEKIKKQLAQLRRLDQPVPEPRITSSMTSAELIADPVKGKIFVGYFGQLKKKIQNTVFKNAGRNLRGHGVVCLGFVLNAEGQLEQLAVLTKGTEADDSIKALALRCIREAAPFGNFPKDLGPRRIFFNITIYFDGT